MAFDTKNIRNIALFGHGNSGKTTLNEAALYTANMITDMGRVDDGKTVSDWTEQEIAKKISINSSISYLEWN
ncbi:MAG TPA: GTP-binding protein, partial [Spirochaetota bacterium]|nr:GTP-binding protein [Spirochaetota bacterium]